AELDDVEAEPLRLGEQLHVDERSLADQLEVVEHLAADELEREVDVAYAQTEQRLHQRVVDVRVQRPLGALTGAVEAVGAHDVGVVDVHEPERLAEVGEVERHVGIGVQHEIGAGFGQPGLHAPAQLAVHVVVHDPDAGIGCRQLVGDLPGAVVRRGVDDQDLVRGDRAVLAQLVAGLPRRVDGAEDHLLLVPHGEEEREAPERGRHPARTLPIRRHPHAMIDVVAQPGSDIETSAPPEPSTRAVAAFYIATAAVLYVIVAAANIFLPHSKDSDNAARIPGQSVLGGWLEFDSTWYTSIAAHGYYYIKGQQSPVAFFPAYPLVVRVLTVVFRNEALAAVVLTVVCGLVVALLYWRWLGDRLHGRQREVAFALLLLYPYAWFLYGTAYADAFFLALVLGAFLAADRRNWLLAGV